ncbi:hypothetical protein ACFR9U_03930 [Halorientalis brevis]|uniref:Secreted protein n=1 Tax=Halorientalis brevis TaxID=1126241 RepID=A0ABD6C7U6_9EURY|nr:hypothetical protein [Halorientalis brevis]
MIQHISVSRVLVAIGIVLLIAPALAPVQAMHFHNTGAGTTANGTELEEHGVRVVAYENLSERGQELYVRALRNHGQYAVPLGQGAPDDFHYVTNQDSDDDAGPSERRPGTIAIERPPDADLPPADEPSYHAEEARERAERAQERAERKQAEATPADGTATAGNETATPATEPTPSSEERQEQLAEQRREIERYDLMETRTGPPPLTASSNLVRLLSVVVGVLAIGVGGYLTSRP